MKNSFFISTAIDYPSEKPHIGHCLEKIQSDVIARYKRLQDIDVHFSTGTDEHGFKIQRRAKKAGKNPQEFVDQMSRYFTDMDKILNISNDDFIRTTEKRHIKIVQAIIKKIYKKGDIYKGKYKGLYCVDCETFYLLKDLENGKCPIHKKPIEVIEEETYFFRASKYQKQLQRHIKKNKKFIIPENKRNEILNRLKEPLQNLSISRKTVKWGIPLPFDKKFSLFVWVDALCNYLTTISYPSNKFKKFWPADVHVIGKDIVWHHAVIWSSLLLSLGLSLPKTIFIHGFVTSGGQKMSKSLGNVVDPFELVEKYGTDAVRYFLLREFSPFSDGDFSYQRFEERYNSDLASGLGNLTARVITMAGNLNLNQQKIKFKEEKKVKEKVNSVKKNYQQALAEFRFNEALQEIWKLISFCDRIIEKERPWEDKDNSLSVIYNLLFALAYIAQMLEPFLPETSEKILQQLGVKAEPWKFKIKKGKPLFPRL